jgi:hypothetical protein
LEKKRIEWLKFITRIENNLHEPKPNTYKIAKHLNHEIKERGNIHCPFDGNLPLQYYQKLRTDTNYKQETYKLKRRNLRSCMYVEEIITLDDLEYSLKNL